MPTPSADALAALARSSPWRWTSLRFSVSRPADRWKPDAVRAWLRRPDRLRVESMDGALLQVVREPPGNPAPAPSARQDGLVADRRRSWDHDLDDPMYQDYHWVAMLDPVELADGRDRDTDALVAALDVQYLAEADHGGRPVWEAVVRTTPAYEPRCGCCPLLRSREVDLDEYRDDPQHVLAEYPDAYRVRLDLETGVCVLTEQLGGLNPGHGHDLRIEAVDEPMDDALFVAPRRRW